MLSILIVTLVVVALAQAITLPNGFTIDERLHLVIQPRANYALERCERPYGGCSDDCSTELECFNANHIVTGTRQCDDSAPYCVKNATFGSFCTLDYPTTSPACLTKALNYFICTGDGQFPDPTDNSKYHVCNGATHTIVTCPANHQYMYDPMNPNPYENTDEFACRFATKRNECYFESFYCNFGSNTFHFRPRDNIHYAYCIDMGTMKKVAMFKCPTGTRHYGRITATGSVDCVPIPSNV